MEEAASEMLKHKIRTRRKEIWNRLLKWAMQNDPGYPWREKITPYRILVSELLLRKTRADQVSLIFSRLVAKYPSIDALAASNPAELEGLIYSLGRTKRASKMVDIAHTICQVYDGKIPNGEKELLRAIGSQSTYTVNAIRCFAYQERVAIFDVNIKRLIQRLFSVNLGQDAHKKQISWEIAEQLLPRENFRQFNWALLDLGRTVCTNNVPDCPLCPLRGSCDYAKRSVH